MAYLVYILFTLSGFIGLIYESLWARYLKLFLGHSSYGQVLTLAIFMGGLGLGSFLAGRYGRRIRNPFYAYAVIEVLIGLGAVAYHQVYVWTTELFYSSTFIPSLSPVVVNLVKIGLSTLMTGPLAILIGMTFPTLAIALMRLTRDAGKVSLPWLYFTNSLGAAAGILATSYYFVAKFGLPGSLLFAGGGNILIGGIFYLIARGVDRSLTLEAVAEIYSESVDKGTPAASFELKPVVLILLTVSCLTGLSSFIYEIGWIRLLSLMFGSSTHSFDIMISAFILGLSAGGFYAKRLLAKSRNLIGLLAAVQILMGSCALLSICLYKPFFYLMNDSNQIFLRTGPAYCAFSVFKYLLALLLMCPTSFFAGITLPVVTYYLTNRSRNEKYTGTVYGWNTVGSILGAVLGGLVLLPLLQLKYTIVAGALIDIAIGIVLVSYFRLGQLWRYAAWAAAIVALAPAVGTRFSPAILTAGTFRGLNDIRAKRKPPIAVRDGRTATISIHESPTYMSLKTNGKADGSIALGLASRCASDRATQASLAFYPMSMIDRPYRAAVIGFGTGMTVHHLLSDDLLQAVDVIEIEKEVYNLARAFRPYNRRAYEDPRTAMFFQDAKTFFPAADRKYEVIISEPSNPWVSGVANLFSLEFYTHLARFLSEDGIFVQWLHSYEFNEELLMPIVKAIDTVFPFGQIYSVPNSPDDVLLLASRAPLEPKGLKRFLWSDGIRKELDWLGVKPKLFGYDNYIVSTKALRPMLEAFNVNSVYFPIVDSGAERAFYLRQRVEVFTDFQLSLSPYELLFEGDGFRAILKDIHEAKAEKFAWKKARLAWQVALRSAESEDDWKRIEGDFHQLITDAGLMATWDQDETVAEFRKCVEDGTAAGPTQIKFRFLDSVAREDPEGIKKGLEAIQKEIAPGAVNVFLIRTLAVNILQYGDRNAYREFLEKYVAPCAMLDPYERTYLLALERLARGRKDPTPEDAEGGEDAALDGAQAPKEGAKTEAEN